jgi:glutaconate CoA-transferase subunit A
LKNKIQKNEVIIMNEKNKSSEKKSKVMTPAEAVKEFIRDGQIIASGGFTITRKSYAIYYEMLRQGIKDIKLCHVTPGGPDELLAAGGCLAGITGCYVGDELVQVIHPYCSKQIKSGKIWHEDYSHYSMILRFKAAAMGVPFLPTHSQIGTDLVNPEYDVERRVGLRGNDERYPLEKFHIMKDPFWPDRQNVCLVPALIPDVTIIHAQLVGEKGTARIMGPLGGDIEEAYAGKKVILTCDQLVPEEYMSRDPNSNQLPHHIIDAIVPVDFACHPVSSFMNYDYDATFLRDFHTSMGDETKRKKWLDEWVYGVKDHWHYLEKLGTKRLFALKANPAYAYNPMNDRSAYINK